MKRFPWQASLTILALLLTASGADSSVFQHIHAYEQQGLTYGSVRVHSVRILPFWVDPDYQGNADARRSGCTQAAWLRRPEECVH